MKILKQIGIIISDTARSRSYLYHLLKNKLKPNFIFYLVNNNKGKISGQIASDDFKKLKKNKSINNEKLKFYSPKLKLEDILLNNSIKFEKIPYKLLNNSSFIKKLSERDEKIFIYSGYGSFILGKQLIDTKKIFLHAHGGYLPNYRGSTANFFSLLNQETIGASLIILDKGIDTGPVLIRKKKCIKKFRELIDYYYDCEIRSEVLIKFLKYYEKHSLFPKIQKFKTGRTYYIIHPVLKYISILSNINR